MADNKKLRGKQDRAKIALNEPYEVNYFKRKHDITKEQAEKIIKDTKGNRQKANEAAQKLK
ncbi:hypothetical protein GCM10007881_61460 [Mesorhizobium huakuii]|uniref:DUF3606 domain-containing protein n=1 Tax=Mesorhizobium huakuii TaxID=28104 RepID=UPI00235C9E0B|nr:DUF3606 domain-containing protein [Mesorhizobium huakuii]GLQ82623.1 hypothetical protein GCM10007881_61460 [Mesorhizobium huakuii]